MMNKREQIEYIKQLGPLHTEGKVLQEYRNDEDGVFCLVINDGDGEKLWRHRSLLYKPMEFPITAFYTLDSFIDYAIEHRQFDTVYMYEFLKYTPNIYPGNSAA